MKEHLRTVAGRALRAFSMEQGLRGQQFSDTVALPHQLHENLTRDQLFADGQRLNPLEYAEIRTSADEWVTVEIGPGRDPSGLNRTFTGNSAYIGIEAGINPRFSNGSKRVIDSITLFREDENIMLLEGKTSDQYPELTEVADEVFATYVLDDPRTDNKLVIDDAYRILKPGGAMVIYDRDINAMPIARRLSDAGFFVPHVSSEPRTDSDEFYGASRAVGCYQLSSDHPFSPHRMPPNLLMIAIKPE